MGRAAHIALASLLMCLALGSRAQTITLRVAPTGEVDAKIALPNPNFGASNQQNYDGIFFLLPLTAGTQRAQAAETVAVSQLLVGPGYTLLATAPNPTLPEVDVRIADATVLEDLPGGKVRLTLDLDYRKIRPEHQWLLLTRNVTKEWRVVIELPGSYRDGDVFITGGLTADATGRYVGSSTHTRRATITFPSPAKTRATLGKAAGSLLIGILTLFIQIPALKSRRVRALVGIAVLAIAWLGLAAWFGYTSRWQSDFLELSAGALPHALFALFAALYFIVARRRQVVVAGSVTIDGSSAEFAEVSLIRIDAGKREVIGQSDELSNSRYRITAWCRAPLIEVVVTASASGAVVAESGILQLQRGRAANAPTLNLTWLPTARPS